VPKCEISNQDYCDTLLQADNNSTDFYYTFNEVSSFGYTRQIIFLLVLFIVVPALYYPSKYLKNKAINKKNFEELKQIIFKSSYKSSFIILGVNLVLFVLCYIYLGTFEITVSNEAYVNGVPNNLFLAFLVQFISIYLQSIVCLNLGLIVLSKIKNYFGAIIFTYASYWLIEFILEIFIEGILINNILKIQYFGRLCSLVNGFVVPVDALSLICPFIIVLLTGIIVYKKYSTYNYFLGKVNTK